MAGDRGGDEPLDTTFGTDQEPILDMSADQFHHIPLGYVQGVSPPENNNTQYSFQSILISIGIEKSTEIHLNIGFV